MNGSRILAEDIPSWLGHDATNNVSAIGNENETEVHYVETRTWAGLVFESDSTVVITMPYETSTCC